MGRMMGVTLAALVAAAASAGCRDREREAQERAAEQARIDDAIAAAQREAMRRGAATVDEMSARVEEAIAAGDETVARAREAIAAQEELARRAAGAPAPLDDNPLDDEPPPPPPPSSDRCAPQGAVGRVRATARTLRLCVDEDGDGWHDRCADVDRRTGKVTLTEPTDAEHALVHPGDLYLAGGPDDDRRPIGAADVEVDGDRAEVCPTTRACLRLAPLVLDGEALGEVRTRADDAVLAAAIGSDEAPRVEVWDLATGRRRSRVVIAGLPEDAETNLFPAFVGDALVVGAMESATEDVRGWIYTLDGRNRRPLAGGSTRLDGDYVTALDARTLAAVERAPEEPPVAEDGGDGPPPPRLVGQDLASGRVLHRFDLPDFDDTDDAVVPAGGRVAAWVHELGDDRVVDLLDFATRRRTVVKVPLCY